MKCSACANNECEGKYENRYKCLGEKEGIDCSCYCRRTKTEVFFSSALSIGTGVAVAAAGIGLTVATGGMAAIIGGAAIVGSGTSLIMSPIQKLVTKECVTFTDSAKEVALGATIGAVTGPIGAFGSTASRTATVAAKVGIRMTAGTAAGATSGVICETAKVLKGEEVSWESFGKSVAIGAVAGSIGGASTSIAHSCVCKPVADVIGKPAMRVITQAGTSMATDAGVQFTTTGKVDPSLLLANTTGQLVCGVTGETVKGVTKRTSLYKDKLNKKHLKDFNKNEPDKSKHLTPSQMKDFKNSLKEINNLKQKQQERLKLGVPKIDTLPNGPTKVADSNVYAMHVIDGQLGIAVGDTNIVLVKDYKGNYIYDGHIRDNDYKKVYGRPNRIQNLSKLLKKPGKPSDDDRDETKIKK